MRCVYFDCSQGASAELMLGALTAARDSAHASPMPVVYRLPGGVRVRCAHAAAGQVVGRCVEYEFPEGLSPDEELTHAEFDEFAQAATPEGAASELMARIAGALDAAIERSRPSARRAQRSSPGVTRRMAAALAALALELATMGVERAYYSPVNAGDARLAPAVLRLAGEGGVRVYMTPGAGELLSLDGAAALAALDECASPALAPQGGGVGIAGERQMYALLGERMSDAAQAPEAAAQRTAEPAQTAASAAGGEHAQAAASAAPAQPDVGPGSDAAADALPVSAEQVALIECNIDDMTPEQLAYACQLLLERGALDVWQTPIIMKKGRMAAQLSVLCAADATERLAQEVLRQTSTLGVRIARYERRVLPRSQRTVDTRFGPLRVKLAPGKAAPEFEDCRAAAQRCGAPIAEVYAAAHAALDARTDG